MDHLRYAAAACQTDLVNPVDRAAMRSNTDRMLSMIDSAVAGSAPFLPVRLVVFPEFAHAAPIFATVPELLDTLHLDGCIVTLDAMGCQKDIAAKIRDGDADYLLVLKANHGRAFEAVREHFEHFCFGRGSGGRPVFDAFDEGHGRLVRRRVFASPAARELEPLHDWPDLRTVLAVETIRSVNGTGKTEAEIRYFLTSCGDDPTVLVRAIRRHWSIENALHWVLDVTFREDDSRVRDRTAARNFALVRKIALNLVAADRSSQTSVRGRRKKAAWNDDYMLRIITRQVHA